MAFFGDQNAWDDARTERLKKLFADGLSASRIASELNREFKIGLTRNAVCGKLSRLGLHTGTPGRAVGPRVRKQRAPAQSSARVTRPSPPPRAAPPIEPDNDQPDPQFACTLIELTDKSCRWPYGHPAADTFRFCGVRNADLAAGIPYCERHRRKAAAVYQPKPETHHGTKKEIAGAAASGASQDG